jgi:hypothetical protein
MHDDPIDDSTSQDQPEPPLSSPGPITAGRRRWPLAIGGLTLVVAAIVAPAWWTSSTTVPQGEHAAATASLAEAEDTVEQMRASLAEAEDTVERTRASLADARREQAATAAALVDERATSSDLAERHATLEDATTTMEAELARIQAEVADLAEERAATRARLEPAFLAGRAFGYLTVSWLPEDAQALVTDGLDTASPDAILTSLGQEEPFLDWIELRSAWVQLENALYAIEDPELAQHYERYLDSELGSSDEVVALNEMTFRLAELLLGPLMDEAARCVHPAEPAPLRATTRDC